MAGWQEASQDLKVASRQLWNELNLVTAGGRAFPKSDEVNNPGLKYFLNFREQEGL